MCIDHYCADELPCIPGDTEHGSEPRTTPRQLQLFCKVMQVMCCLFFCYYGVDVMVRLVVEVSGVNDMQWRPWLCYNNGIG